MPAVAGSPLVPASPGEPRSAPQAVSAVSNATAAALRAEGEDAQRGDVLAEIAWAHLVIARCHLNAGDYGAAIRSLRTGRLPWAVKTWMEPASSM